MGYITKANFENLVPTQDTLKEWQFKDLILDYLENPGDLIIPVRKHPSLNKFLILDGHHGSNMMYLLKEIYSYELCLWVAENKRDFVKLDNKEYYNKCFYNKNILARFGDALVIYDKFDYPKSIKELASKYAWLKSPENIISRFFLEKRNKN